MKEWKLRKAVAGLAVAMFLVMCVNVLPVNAEGRHTDTFEIHPQMTFFRADQINGDSHVSLWADIGELSSTNELYYGYGYGGVHDTEINVRAEWFEEGYVPQEYDGFIEDRGEQHNSGRWVFSEYTDVSVKVQGLPGGTQTVNVIDNEHGGKEMTLDFITTATARPKGNGIVSYTIDVITVINGIESGVVTYNFTGNKAEYSPMTLVSGTPLTFEIEYVEAIVDPEPQPEELVGEWLKDSKGWWYRNADGSYTRNNWQLIDDEWYYFDGVGYMATGWIRSGNEWYYLQSSGEMVTGWLKLGNTWYYLQGSGAMRTGWLQEGGVWYYLQSSGAMKTGWLKLGNIWYYLQGSGAMKTGWIKDGSVWYYLQSSGAMKTGWLEVGNQWYYLNGSGAMLTGWQTVGGVRYFMNNSGAWVPNQR